MGRPLKVVVVGMGTAGTASAIFLSRMRHQVTVLERVAVPKAVGAGIGLQPIGLTVLKHLGILDNILSHGSRIDRLHCVNHNDRTVLDCRYAQLDSRLYGLGLHRGVLFEELRQAAEKEPVSFRTGCEVEGIDIGPKSVVRFSDANGPAEIADVDLVIIADGARSKLRNRLGVKHSDRPYPYGCVWSIIPDPERTFSGEPVLFQRVKSAKNMLGFLPSGRLHGENIPQVSLFWSIKVAEEQQLRARGLQAWKDEVLSHEPRAEPLLKHLTDISMLQIASYNDVSMPAYNHGNVVFLGDAAHANSPQLGQGANLALVDAWTLATTLQQGEGQSVEANLAQYDRKRHQRVGFYQFNSRMLTPVFQSDSRVLASLRDVFMGPICYFPPTRQQVLTTLVGAQASFIPLHRIPQQEYLGFAT